MIDQAMIGIDLVERVSRFVKFVLGKDEQECNKALITLFGKEIVERANHEEKVYSPGVDDLPIKR